MSKLIDHTGQVFHYLTVIDRATNNDRNAARWNCKCKCGKSTVKIGLNLRRDATRSCGCYQIESVRKAKSAAGRNTAYRAHVNNAKRRHYTPLNRDLWEILSIKKCHWCGAEPSNTIIDRTLSKESQEWSKFVYNGIDRLDSSKDYEPDNCVPCCSNCNNAKSNLTLAEWNEWLNRITEYRSKNTIGRNILRGVVTINQEGGDEIDENIKAIFA